MKTKKIISILAILALIFNVVFPTLSLALEQGKAELKVVSSASNVKRGDEITVSVKLNTNSVSDITGLQVYMYYDSNVLEPVGQPTRELPVFEQELASVTLDESEHNVNIMWTTVSAPIDYNGNLFSQKFKVKEDAKIGTSNLQIIEENGENAIVGSNLQDFSEIEIPYTIQNTSIDITVPIDSISLNKTSTELWTGDTEKLTVLYNPEDATNKTVTWTSSNNAVATVEDGTVIAVGKGTTTITATTENGKTATCNVEVKQPVTGVTLNKTTLDLEKDQTEKLVATVLPTDADADKTVTWNSDNNAVATVSQDGTVTAVGKGSCDITVTTQNGKTATCKVTVGVPLKSIAFKDDITSKTMNKGEEFTLEVVYNPEDTDADKTITWSSTDTSVATVEGGKVTAIGGGETEIKATTVNGLEAICKVKVEVPLTSISIKTETSIQFGQTEKLEVTYNPVDTTADKTIAWKSNDESIAKVSTDGTVEGVGVGETTITATASNGQEVTCKVTVLPVELNSISITEQNIILNKGENETLTVTYNPENTTEDKTVTWESSNEDAVTVSEDGVITAVGAGNATITAKVGDKTATTQVEVKVPLESIRLNETEKQLNKGDDLQLSVTYNPEDTTADKTVTWTSTDDTVATVDENGKVTALKAGTTYIKAKVEDKEVSCKIDVVVPLTGIDLNKDVAEILKGQTEKLTVTLVPEDTTYTGKVEWTSSDDTIATVDENGNVKGIKEGTVTITAKAVENGNEIIDTAEITVKEIPLNSIAIDIADFDLGIGRTQSLGVVCNPENTTDDINVEWTSSDVKVATVDENGTVTGLAEGTAVITAKVGDKTASVTVTVKSIPITSITIDAPAKVLIGGNVDIKVTVNPTDATYNISDLKFVSSNSDVLTINEDGTIVAKGLGKAILTVEAPNGVKSQVEIEVVDDTADIENGETTVEEEKAEAEENKSNSPKTGDIAVEMFVSLMVISGLGIAVILRKRFRK